MKTCSKCNQSKSIISFAIRTAAKDGLRGACKGCIEKERQQQYNANKEQIQSKVRTRRVTDKERFRQYDLNKARDNYEGILYQSTKYRAKADNIEHTITKEDIIIPDTCPYLRPCQSS